jgi:tagaturonate reductase
LKKISEATTKTYGHYPEKILQFGEGNFLRGFADWMIDNANENGDYEGSIVICQPVELGLTDLINSQNGIYTLVMRGIEDGSPVEIVKKITSISRSFNPYEDYESLMALGRSTDLEVVISNTTEAGIVYQSGNKLSDAPPSSFPAKVTALLYERYKAFKGDPTKGILFLPVELIDKNGDQLKKIILQYATEWELEPDFITWIHQANKFTNTLVDRIVTGYPKDNIDYFEDKLGYKDDLLVTSELFNLWVIEGEKDWKSILPIHNNSAHVLWTTDATPYKTRKVRILNGAHTSTVLAAYLSGHETVLDLIKDPTFDDFLEKLISKEIIPTIELPVNELESFAFAVKDRFSNPYIHHKLLDISLNSCSKFNARCLPTLLDYNRITGELAEGLCFAFAAFIKFYQGSSTSGSYIGTRSDGTNYPIRDSEDVLAFFETVWSLKDMDTLANVVLSHKDFWSGKDLTEVPGLASKIAYYLNKLNTTTIKDILREMNLV